MKRKVWDITVKDNPNRVVMGENDEFYTTDTEAYLVFKLDDENFNPATAVLTLENRNDGSLKNETVDVIDGLIEWEMPQRYIEHFGNWQGQLVYEDTKDGQPELYTSAQFTFVVNAHIGDKKKPSLVEIENWEKFIRDGTELIETWEDMEDLRQANEARRQANYQELLDTGALQTNINTKLEALEEEYAPKLTEVTAQLAQKVGGGVKAKLEDLSPNVLSAIEGGEGTSFELLSIPQDKSVTPEKTTFFDYERTKNLFNVNWEVGTIDSEGNEAYHSRNVRTDDFIELEFNQPYVFSFQGIESEGLTIYLTLYDSNHNFVSRSTRSNGSYLRFSTDSNAKYAKFHLFKSGVTDGKMLMPEKTQLETGVDVTDYEPYWKATLKENVVKDKTTTPQTSTFFKIGKNLFNNEWTMGQLDSDGLEDTRSSGARTKPIFLEQGAYTISMDWGVSDEAQPTFYIHFYGDESETSLKLVSSSGEGKRTLTFNVDSTISYVRFMTHRSGVADEKKYPLYLQLEKNVRATEFEEYGLYLDSDYLNSLETTKKIETDIKQAIQFENEHVKHIAHRGYSWEAPECTYHAYILAKEKGFRYVEADIQWTKDEVPVLFHDVTLDNTSNGTGQIRDYTLAELKELDFGSWFNPIFEGTKILTYKEFLMLCKKLNLKAYLDLKDSLTQERAEFMVNEAKKVGMLRALTWLGGFNSHDNIRIYDEKARIATLPGTAPTNLDAYVQRLTDEMNVFLNVQYELVTRELSDLCAENGIGLEAWIVNDEAEVRRLANFNVQGITTDMLNIPKILHDSFVAP